MRWWIPLSVPLGCALVSCFLSVAPVAAQVSVEMRGGATVGNHEPSAAGLELLPGPSFSGAIEVTPMSWISFYGTYLRSQFGCEEGFCTGRDVTVGSSGYGGGARLHPPRLPWLRAGLLRLRTTVHTDAESAAGDPGPGFEVATGLTIPLAGSIRLHPALAYRSRLGSSAQTTTIGGELGIRIGLPVLR